MIALRQRFQGIMNELLSNALHYASLDIDAQNPLVYYQDAIRFYCHGEFQLALGSLLNVSYLSLNQMQVQHKIFNSQLDVTPKATLVTFNQEDNPRFNLTQLLNKPSEQTLQPPRSVKSGELLVAVLESGHCFEILCLFDLSDQQIDKIRVRLPKTVEELVPGASLAERLMAIPLPVSADRKENNAALAAQIEDLTRCLVLSGASFTLSSLIPSPDIFGKLPQPLRTDQTLVQTSTLEELRNDIQLKYQAQNIKTNLITGL